MAINHFSLFFNYLQLTRKLMQLVEQERLCVRMFHAFKDSDKAAKGVDMQIASPSTLNNMSMQ